METITEIIFKDECIHHSNGLIPLNNNDEFYFSLKSFNPKDEEFYKKVTRLPEKMVDEYLIDIKNNCQVFHNMHFKVVDKTISVERDYSKFLRDDTKESKVVVSLTVEKVY